MKTLLLMRHAKSSWNDPDVSDHDRPLNARGRKAAPLMGTWLQQEELAPDHAFLSSALRCQETWERLSRNLAAAPNAATERRLYMASPDRMLEIAQTCPDEAEVMLVLSHQPSTSAFARKLCGGTAPPRCARAFKHFPTAAIAVMTTEVERWSDLTMGSMTFTRFAIPKELIGELA